MLFIELRTGLNDVFLVFHYHVFIRLSILAFYNKFTLLFVSMFTFLVSYYLLGYYVEGDQYYYHSFYKAVATETFLDSLYVGKITLDAGEPISLGILWLGANLGIPKDIYISLLNVLLIIGVYNLCRKYKTPWFSFLLLVSGFYFIVLMTGAERLKISYIFIVWSLLFTGYYRSIFVILGSLSHFQAIIFVLVYLIKRIFYELTKVFRTARISKNFLAVLFSITIILFSIVGKLLSKIEVYYNGELKIIDIINVLMLFALSFLIFRKWDFKVWGVLLFLPFIIILGGSRINIMAVSFVFYMYIIHRKMSNPFVLLMLFYFAIKSYGFLVSIFENGHGFG